MPFVGCSSTLRPKEDCEKSYEFLRSSSLYFATQNAFTAPSAATYVRKLFEEAPQAKDTVKGKLAVVTGVTIGGAGYHICEELALQAEMHVVLMGRSEQKLKDAMEAVRKEAATRGLPEPTLFETKYDADDLSTVVSGAEFTSKLAKESYDGKIFVLVNNAGATGTEYELTKQGVEAMLGRNFLAPHMMTEKLITLLQAAATSDYKPRVVNVASMGQASGQDFDPVRMLSIPDEGGAPEGMYKEEDGKKMYSGEAAMVETVKQYCRAKMAMVAGTVGMQKKYPQINFTSQQPGSIVSNFGTDMGFARIIYYYGFYLFQYSPSQGAATSLRAALDPDFNSEKDLQGAYLHADQNPWYPADPTSQDPATKQPYTFEAYGDATVQNADKLIAAVMK